MCQYLKAFSGTVPIKKLENLKPASNGADGGERDVEEEYRNHAHFVQTLREVSFFSLIFSRFFQSFHISFSPSFISSIFKESLSLFPFFYFFSL